MKDWRKENWPIISKHNLKCKYKKTCAVIKLTINKTGFVFYAKVISLRPMFSKVLSNNLYCNY